MQLRRTVIGSLPRTVLATAQSVGLDASRLAREAGLDLDLLNDLDRRVPVETYADLWRALVRDPRADLLLEAAPAVNDLSAVGVVGYVMSNSPTISAAFSAYSRHRRILGDLFDFQIQATPDAFSITFIVPEHFREIPLFSEATVALNHALVRVLGGRAEAPTVIRFPHARERAAPRLSSIVGDRLEFDCPHTTLVYPGQVGEAPVLRADPALFHFIERHALAVAAEIPDTIRWADRVRRFVLGQLERGEPSPAEVARSLALSERTLQRRLGEEGTSFLQIVDQCRRELALRYVGDASLSFGEIAFLLGYSEQSAFHRAFRRWTGRTPAETRHQRLAG